MSADKQQKEDIGCLLIAFFIACLLSLVMALALIEKVAT